MNKQLWMIALAGLVVLLAGCGASDAEAERVVRVTLASPAEGQAPSNTLPPTAATPVAALTAKDVQRITLADAKSLLDNGTAVLYDARSVRAYRSKHAAGAISLPEDEVAARASELPADKVLIFY
jgi:predicted component of type VI protein secretion system